jgi:hypothetical protein
MIISVTKTIGAFMSTLLLIGIIPLALLLVVLGLFALMLVVTAIVEFPLILLVAAAVGLGFVRQILPNLSKRREALCEQM